MSDAVAGPSRSISPTRSAWLLGLLFGALVLLSLGGEGVRGALRYERRAVLDGELWRLLTGHLVHGTTQHLLLNAAALALIAALFPREFSLLAWLAILALSMAAIDLGFVFLEPQLQWYVGFSGVLHGALAAGAISWLGRESRPVALALLGGLAGKLALEQWYGALPLSGDLPVVVDAHLYGAIGGAIAAIGLGLRSRCWPPADRSL